MPQSGGAGLGLFGGLVKGFGGTMLEIEQRNHEAEQRDKQLRISTLQHAGDNAQRIIDDPNSSDEDYNHAHELQSSITQQLGEILDGGKRGGKMGEKLKAMIEPIMAVGHLMSGGRQGNPAPPIGARSASGPAAVSNSDPNAEIPDGSPADQAIPSIPKDILSRRSRASQLQQQQIDSEVALERAKIPVEVDKARQVADANTAAKIDAVDKFYQSFAAQTAKNRGVSVDKLTAADRKEIWSNAGQAAGISGGFRSFEPKATDVANLRKQGLMYQADPVTGEQAIVPVPLDQLSAEEAADLEAKQALPKFRKAQTDLADAKAEYERTRSDPNSPAAEQAQQRLDIAQRNSDTYAASLGIRQQNADTASGTLALRGSTQANKYYDPAVHADDRLALMKEAAGPDFAGNGGQSDLSLLFNHIGMTLSAQKGARITNAEIERAITARSLPEDLMAKYDKVVSGKFLSPTERKDMITNGITVRNRAWYTARRQARLAGETDEPATDPSLPALIMPGGGSTAPTRTPGAATPAPAPKGANFSVTDPNGKVHPFDTKAQADAFRALIKANAPK